MCCLNISWKSEKPAKPKVLAKRTSVEGCTPAWAATLDDRAERDIARVLPEENRHLAQALGEMDRARGEDGAQFLIGAAGGHSPAPRLPFRPRLSSPANAPGFWSATGPRSTFRIAAGMPATTVMAADSYGRPAPGTRSVAPAPPLSRRRESELDDVLISGDPAGAGETARPPPPSGRAEQPLRLASTTSTISGGASSGARRLRSAVARPVPAASETTTAAATIPERASIAASNGRNAPVSIVLRRSARPAWCRPRPPRPSPTATITLPAMRCVSRKLGRIATVRGVGESSRAR